MVSGVSVTTLGVAADSITGVLTAGSVKFTITGASLDVLMVVSSGSGGPAAGTVRLGFRCGKRYYQRDPGPYPRQTGPSSALQPRRCRSCSITRASSNNSARRRSNDNDG